MPQTLHAAPVNDLIAHDTGTDRPECVCGPAVRPFALAGDGMGVLIVHASLDGRERTEGGS